MSASCTLCQSHGGVGTETRFSDLNKVHFGVLVLPTASIEDHRQELFQNFGELTVGAFSWKSLKQLPTKLLKPGKIVRSIGHASSHYG